jgi:GNAT superfamily N-acetyltransferase
LRIHVRRAERVDIPPLAKLWHDGWHDAHAHLLPAEIIRVRTPESFPPRLQAALADVGVVGPVGSPAGFYMLKPDELYQFYVSVEARGTGVAQALLVDAEARLSASVQTAWLACAIGNARAARFYEKSGWWRTGTMINRLETPDGEFPLEVWRYEKALERRA